MRPNQHVPMEAGARPELSKTIRSLRERLIGDLRDAAEAKFRLALPLAKAELGEELHAGRARLEAWIDEQLRALPEKKRTPAERDRFLGEAVREAAYTWLNRLVLLRHMEAMGLSRPAVVSGGWTSAGYRDFREFAPGLCGDESEGYAFLLRLVFDELALDLPGLFGEVGLGELFPVPPATLRYSVEALNAPAIESVWRDDTVLGWVYQYWNDPERERLDAKINERKKIEPHEIASKTQMFTDRYMVEWLLQNSLGAMWLAMCKKHGWRADAEDVLEDLDRRRAEWREKRDKGEVDLDAFMPIAEGLEDRWKFYVPQPIPEDAVQSAPGSVRGLKILDPACGSGHFLVIAFDLLAALYQEEARHRGESWSAQEIAASILESNLHGIDIDPRAVQIAAAALHVKAQIHAPGVRASRMNLVAPALRLASLPENDPALITLLREVKAETGIPEELTRRIIKGLEGADHLGTLLQVDAEIDGAINAYEGELRRRERVQGDLLTGFADKARRIDREEAKASLLDKLDTFLAHHAGGDDLGLRLDGEQLASGIRFLRMVREGSYDLVVGNPPYQGTSKMAEAKYIAAKYPRGKADLYAAFLERGLQLVREGGVSAALTMRGWMFVKTFAALREHLLERFDLRLLGDVDRGAFEEVPNEVLAASISVFRHAPPAPEASIAIQPTPLSDNSYDRSRTARKRAALLLQVGRHSYHSCDTRAVPGGPLVYWWQRDTIGLFTSLPILGTRHSVAKGITTCDDTRFLRMWWEVKHSSIRRTRAFGTQPAHGLTWHPYMTGGADCEWFHPLREVIKWADGGLEIATFEKSRFGRGARYYYQLGVAFSMIGNSFNARLHRFPSILGDKGASVYGGDIENALLALNRSQGREILQALNPSMSFQVNDVKRLPLTQTGSTEEVISRLEQSFTQHEAQRETSIEYRGPGLSCWDYTVRWAQTSVDRAEGSPLPPWEPVFAEAGPLEQLHFEIGVTLGRFAEGARGLLESEGQSGLLFVTAGKDDALGEAGVVKLSSLFDGLPTEARAGASLSDWLRNHFFGEHRKRYENRPVFLPLSSGKRSFVAFTHIHSLTANTLRVLLTANLLPEQRRLEGEMDDLRSSRTAANLRTANDAERRYAELQRLHTELCDFIDKVRMCAEQGPPPTDAKCKPREVDAPFEMDLDDGVMINAAALWPLLEPQWKDPKKWWKELANAEGKKDYDWSHLAARYFPSRVDGKCRKDPSLAVAHKCFWRYHPARAYAWELRLQNEIGPDFRIDEPDADEHRTRLLADHAEEAAEIEAKELKRRQRKAAKEDEQQDLDLGDVDGEEDDADAA